MNVLPPQIFKIFLAVILLEYLWARRTHQHIHSRTETAANFAILLGNHWLKPLSFAWKAVIFSLAQHYAFTAIPMTPATCLAAFLAVELNYYWYHRISHRWPFLWTIHHTHHSGSYMNFTTAMRLNWLGGFIAPFFFLPLVLAGFSPVVIMLSLALGLFYQFFLHTEAFGSWGIFEGWLNTPSAHRVHHGSNQRYIDKNFGAALIVYDRLFGTYEKEEEKVHYGVTTGPVSGNPFQVVFGPLWRWLRGNLELEKQVGAANEYSLEGPAEVHVIGSNGLPKRVGDIQAKPT